jgi:hypothetical protein
LIDPATDAGPVDQVVHPVEAAEQSGLATAGRSDEGRHLPVGHLQIDVMQRLGRSVVEIQILDVHQGRSAAAGGLPSGEAGA